METIKLFGGEEVEIKEYYRQVFLRGPSNPNHCFRVAWNGDATYGSWTEPRSDYADYTVAIFWPFTDVDEVKHALDYIDYHKKEE